MDCVLALLRREITCSLCGNLYQEPYSFTDCGHCFCYSCIHGKLDGSSSPVCPTCLQPVHLTHLYFNRQCQKIVQAVQSSQQTSAGISAVPGRQDDKECQTGSVSAGGPSMQQVSLPEPELNVHPASTVCRDQVQQKDVTALQDDQQHTSVAHDAEDCSTVHQADTSPLQRAQAAGDSFSMSTMAQLPASLWCYNHEWALEIAALPPPDMAETAALGQEVLAMEAVLADLQQRLQTEGCVVPNADKQPAMESKSNQAVVPAAEHALLSAETGAAQAQCKLPALPDATVSGKQDSTDCCVAQKPGAVQQNVAPDHARQAMPCGTAGSLADIDAVMQARGYRLSCMPGPSGLPNTLASYGAELHSAVQYNAPSPDSLDIETDSPLTYQGLEAEAACSDKLPDSVAVKLHHEVPLQQCLMDKDLSAAQPSVSLQPAIAKASHHSGAAGGVAEPAQPAVQQQVAQHTLPLYNGKVQTGPLVGDASAQRPQSPVVLPAADPSQSSQQPAASPTGAANGDASPMDIQQPTVTQTVDANDAASPVRSQQPAASPTDVAKDGVSPMHSQQPAVTPIHAPLIHSQQPASTPITAANHCDDDDNDVDGASSPMHAAAHEDTTVPDSAGLTQHGRHSDHQRQAVHTKSPSTSKHSHAPSDGASLEAALALAALASGEKRPQAQPSTADQAELSTRSSRQRRQQQCDSSRVPLKTIQRSAAVQRQPLKPAWQHSGRAEGTWGAKGRRTSTQNNHNPPQRGRTAMQRSRDAKHPQKGSNKQANGSKAVGVGHSGLGSDCTADEVDNASKPSQNRGVPPGSTQAGTQAVSSTARVVGSQQPGRKKRGKVTPSSVHDESKLASEPPGSNLAQGPDAQQLQLRTDAAEAAGSAHVGDGNDDDDFKPDVRRRPKSHRSSPKGSRKRPRLSQPRACPGDTPAQADSGADGNPVGQVLLSWDGLQRCWNQRIITAFCASKAQFHVKGGSKPAEWVDLTEVQWVQSDRPPQQCMLICQLVRQSVEIWWPGNNKYYGGTVTEYLPEKEKHHMLYDDGEKEDEDMASQRFRFCPALPPLDDSLLPVLGGFAVQVEDSAISADSPHSTGKGTAPIDPVANIQSVQPNLQQAAQPTAFLDATDASRPLSHNPEAAGISSQGKKHIPVSAVSTDKKAALDAGAASDACTAVPRSKPEPDPVVQQAAGPQRQADAFDYPASQAENVASQKPAPGTTSPSNCKPGSGPGRGRDRSRKRAPGKRLAPGKQLASAKRQKQLQVPRGRAANMAPKARPTGGKQLADGPHHQPTRSRLAEPRRSRRAEPACQVMGTSPSRTDSGVKGVVKAEPLGDCANQARQQIPSTDTDAHASKSRQLDSLQGQPQEQPLQQQQAGHKQESLGHCQQQQPADGVAEQADAGKTEGSISRPARKVVVGSGLPRPKQDEIKRLCRRLRAHPGCVVDSHTTHLVVQVDTEGVGQQRSLKYFQGLARGCWLVRWAWVEACAAAGQWLDEAPFELAGDHFALGAPRTARLKCQTGAKGLFQGISFCMGPGYKGTGVSPHQLIELLTCTGGHVYECLPPRLTDGSTAGQADDSPDIHIILFGEGSAICEEIRTIKDLGQFAAEDVVGVFSSPTIQNHSAVKQLQSIVKSGRADTGHHRPVRLPPCEAEQNVVYAGANRHLATAAQLGP